jgi:hypothetical protein
VYIQKDARQEAFDDHGFGAGLNAGSGRVLQPLIMHYALARQGHGAN